MSTLPPGMTRHRPLPCHQQSDVGSVTLPDERDKRRVEELFRLHGPDVLAYARRRTATFADAQDALAETFLVCCRRVPDVPDDPLPWLLGVARKVLANQRRSRLRRSALRTRLEVFAGSAPEVSESLGHPADRCREASPRPTQRRRPRGTPACRLGRLDPRAGSASIGNPPQGVHCPLGPGAAAPHDAFGVHPDIVWKRGE